MEITLPSSFEAQLALNKPLRAGVDRTLADFSVWFSESKLPFFTDYTDHGLKHLQEVIQTINGLVPTMSVDSLSSGDVTILVIATLLHDSALHLSEQGFKELIHGTSSDQFVPGLDSEPWSRLWEAYLFSAVGGMTARDATCSAMLLSTPIHTLLEIPLTTTLIFKRQTESSSESLFASTTPEWLMSLPSLAYPDHRT